MSEEKRLKWVIDFTNFINLHIGLFEGFYKLFKTGKSEIDLGDYSINLKSTNFEEISKPKDAFFTTMLLMYLSMKQQEMENIDEYIQLDDEEMLELHNYIEYTRKLPYFVKFIEDVK